VKINEPPWGGKCEVSISGSAAVEITTPITIAANGYVDQPEDEPLFFRFGYLDNAVVSAVLSNSSAEGDALAAAQALRKRINFFGQKSMASSFVWATPMKGNWTIFCFASDSKGAVAEAKATSFTAAGGGAAGEAAARRRSLSEAGGPIVVLPAGDFGPDKERALDDAISKGAAEGNTDEMANVASTAAAKLSEGAAEARARRRLRRRARRLSEGGSAGEDGDEGEELCHDEEDEADAELARRKEMKLRYVRMLNDSQADQTGDEASIKLMGTGSARPMANL